MIDRIADINKIVLEQSQELNQRFTKEAMIIWDKGETSIPSFELFIKLYKIFRWENYEMRN